MPGSPRTSAAVGSDSRLNGTLIAVHDYSFFVGTPYTNENRLGQPPRRHGRYYASRTVATEWGAPMSPGSKNGVHYDTIDYSVPAAHYFDDYVRGISSELRTLGVGSVYWPGLRDGDWYSMTTKTGSGAGISLSLVNASGLGPPAVRLGIRRPAEDGSDVRIRNAATGLYVDGAGATSNGARQAVSSQQQHQPAVDGRDRRQLRRDPEPSPPACTSTAWAAPPTAPPVASTQAPTAPTSSGPWSATEQRRFENRATGLYIDGMGRTADGSTVGQYSHSNSTNQQWQIVAVS